MSLIIDHLVISAGDLDAGIAYVEKALGVPLAGGGKHPLMSTHNRLLHLGDLYLEVIAIDPEAPPPNRPRWFDLDNFTGEPRTTNWVAGSKNLGADLMSCPNGCGKVVDLARGDYRWKMAIPDSGILPFQDAFPAILEWQGTKHPIQALPDHGLRFERLTIGHPKAAVLTEALAQVIKDDRIRIIHNEFKFLEIDVNTPSGIRKL